MSNRPWLRSIGTISVALVLGVSVAGCGGATKTSTIKGVNQAARSFLPTALRKSGVLKIATSLQWPPFDYQSAANRPTGLDIELETDIAKKLGLHPQFTNVAFPAIVPGVVDGRFNIGADELSDNATRRTQVQFVDYYKAGLAVLVKKGTTGISATNLCGVKLALTLGSSQVQNATQISQACTAAGKSAIDMTYFPDSAVTILAVADGRAQAFLTDEAVGLYSSRTTDTSLKELPGTVPGSTILSGIIVANGNDGLAKAVQSALQAAIKDGTYIAIMKKYGVPNEAVKYATIDGQK